MQEEAVLVQPPIVKEYPNVLNLTGTPDSVFDRSVFSFTDMGAWFAYALPKRDARQIGFSGPFLMTQDNGCWLSPMLSQLVLRQENKGGALQLKDANLVSFNSLPGKLEQEFRWQEPALHLKAILIFVDKNTALHHIVIKNESEQEDLQISAEWEGEMFLYNASLQENADGIAIAFENQSTLGQITPLNPSEFEITPSEKSYTITFPAVTLSPGGTQNIDLAHVFSFSADSLAEDISRLESSAQYVAGVLKNNESRWSDKLNAVINKMTLSYADKAYQRVAVKCLQTLTTNWRSAAGFLKHDGLFPSYNYQWFHGFWSWDSWKHAVALAQFDERLAKQQILAMYDFQDEMGMIADCVYRDTIIENHNWRDTKPPLSAWAVWNVFQKSTDTAFLQTMLPKLEQYHDWWYKYRDHDQNGLCEYGSTDGSLIAAKWESGMDNAVRFDDTKLVQNNAFAWSMNRESVDLNSYLYAEKIYLAKIATALSLQNKEKKYLESAADLKEQIQTVFYDQESGWFYDIDLHTKTQLKAFGAEGWIPLWANAATIEQAANVRETMLDTTKFATYIPFPTLAADHPDFDPNGSYWRGPVWLDQACFAIKGLRNYGYEKEAERFTLQLLDRLEGLKDGDAPIRENYHPLTGEGLESNHFSWSAAHLLLLLWEL